MAEHRPSEVTWSEHAAVKAHLLGYARTDVEELVLRLHHQRTRNTGAADWLLQAGALAIAYNFPGPDGSTAHVVTVWRRA